MADQQRLCYGAEEIAERLSPGVPGPKALRRVYRLITEVPPSQRLPVFRLGSVICARPEALDNYLTEQERLQSER